MPHRLVLRFEPGTTAAQRARVRSDLGGRLIRELGFQGAELIALPEGIGVREAGKRLSERPEVAYAEPDFIYRVSSVVPSDPRFTSLWGLHNTSNTDIDALEAWASNTGSASVSVGIVDTGVAYDHPDLAPNVWRNPGESGAAAANGIDDDGNGYVDDLRGWDWVDRDNDPLDLHGHGTHVAGTVGAKGNNSIAVAGVAWDVSLVPLRVLDADGSGTSSSIAAAFAYAGANQVDVVNASLGGPSFSRAVLDSITAYPGTLFVAAAGNDGVNNDSVDSYPCNYAAENVLCVAATTKADGLASFSNYGASTVDLGAPGAGILSTLPKREVRLAEGFGSGFPERWHSVPTWGQAADAYGNYLADSPSGPYVPGTDASVTLNAPIDLSAASDCTLRFALRLDTEKGRDLLILEASRNGNEWSRVIAMSGSTGGGWSTVRADLSDLVGSAETHLRLRLTSDSNPTVGAGADIDDLEVRCIGTAYTGAEVGTFSGTSMATPHVAGAAAVIKAAAPDLTGAGVKGAVLEGVVPSSSLKGRTVTGGRLNLARSLQEVSPVEIAPSPLPSKSEPTPQASFTQSEQLPPAEEQEAAPMPTPSPSPSGATSPISTPTAGPTPTPTPTPSDGSDASPRSLRLRLVKHLVVRGAVGSPSDRCRSSKLVVKRNGSRVGATRSSDSGRFKLRVKDRGGRYVVIAKPTDLCLRAAASGRHSHAVAARDFVEGAEEEATVTTKSGCFTYKRAERRFRRLINTARSEVGVGSLRLDPELSRVARVHTREMARNGALFHTPSATLRSRVIGWSQLGENVGLGATPGSLHRSFMASPAHRDNILHAGFNNVGAGTVKRDGRLWVTLVFQSRDDPGTTLLMPSC